jgi:hypothetical protein
MWVRFWLRNKVQKILARIGMQEVIGVWNYITLFYRLRNRHQDVNNLSKVISVFSFGVGTGN